MASEIRVNSLTNRSGLSTVSITDTGAVVAGIVTATSFSGPLTGNVTGDITATNGTFSGNVSIGGALTYEDVTNVDSIGIITARSGVHVTSGSVGIGTDNPSTKLQVANGHVNVSSGYSYQWGDSHERIEQSDGKIEFFTNNGQQMTLSGSNLGIGTNNPGERLHLTTTSGNCKLRIDAASAASVDFYNAGTRFSDMFTDASTGNFTITNRQNADIIVRTNGTNERLRIDSAGKVGLGTNNPLNPLHIRNDYPIIRLEATLNNYTGRNTIGGYQNLLSFDCDNDNSISNSSIVFNIDGSEKLRVTSGGKIGINDTNPERAVDIRADNCMVQLEGTGGGGRQYSLCSTDNTTGASAGSAGSFVIYDDTSGNARLSITSDGTVHINSADSASGGRIYAGSSKLYLQSGNGRQSFNIADMAAGQSATHEFNSSGNLVLAGGMQASSVNLQNSATSSWFQTGTSIASYPYVWAAKNSSSNTWHSGLQTDGDLYLGGNLAGTNNIGLNGSNGSAWFSGSVAIGGNAAANTIDEYEEGTWTVTVNKSGVSGTAGTPTNRYGYYRRIGGLMFVSFYWYKNSGTFGNNAGEWYISGLPYSLLTLANSAYQFIPGGYSAINGVSYNNAGGTAQANRWQSNSTNGADTLALYGTTSTTNWTSGALEFSGSGVLMLA